MLFDIKVVCLENIFCFLCITITKKQQQQQRTMYYVEYIDSSQNIIIFDCFYDRKDIPPRIYYTDVLLH